MSSLTVSETREALADVIGRAQYAGERTMITKRGKPVAAVVSAADLALLEALEDREIAELIAARKAAGEIGGATLDHDAVWGALLGEAR